MEYEFDVVADMDHSNTLIIGKTRCSALADGVFPKPGEEVADILLDWLTGDCENPEVAFKEFLSRLAEVRKAAVLTRQAVIKLAQSEYDISGEDLREIPEDNRNEFLELILNSAQATAA